MSKRKPFVIYQMFWLGKNWTPWTEYATKEEAEAALIRLRDSPSAKYYSYKLGEDGVNEQTK